MKRRRLTGALAQPRFLLQASAMKLTVLILACLLPIANAADEGHARASWVAEKGEVGAGAPVRTVIRMIVETGWHTYWENPGEVGIPISLKADLPEGWTMGKILNPVPHRITSSDLTSFCLEGEVLLPVTLTPPSGFQGKLPAIQAKLSWLACNDEGCIPGEAELSISSAPEPQTISRAYDALPKPIPGATLDTKVSGNDVVISLTLPEASEIDPTAFEVLPATRNVVAPAAEPRFAKSPDSPRTWIATAAKSEYLEGNPAELTVILSNKAGAAWSASTGAE